MGHLRKGTSQAKAQVRFSNAPRCKDKAQVRFRKPFAEQWRMVWQCDALKLCRAHDASREMRKPIFAAVIAGGRRNRAAFHSHLLRAIRCPFDRRLAER